MAIDASIYGQIQAPPPISPIDNAQKVMTLAQLGYQQQQQQIQMQTRTAMMQAYANNTDPQTGEVNKQGVVSFLARVNPMAAQDLQTQFAGQDKAQAEAKQAQLKAATDAYNITGPAFDYMAALPGDQRAAAYPKVIEQLKAQGVDTSRMDHPYDDGLFNQYYGTWQKSKPALENQLTQANIDKAQGETAKIPSEIAKNLAEARLAPAKLAGEQFGRSSPNSTISNQYAEDPAVKSAKSSQVYMNQMMDAFRKPGPYSDESLALNAMKIKFPGAPDVGSLEEFKHAQGATDAMKSYVSKKLEGLKSDEDRKNLMRDALSTYLPNVASLRGAQKKYYQKAIGQGVPNAADIFAEPGIDQTESEVRALDKDLGPYKPPTDRSGLLGSAAKMLGMGGNQSANASTKAPAIKHGTVEDGFVYMGGDPGKPSSWKKAR